MKKIKIKKISKKYYKGFVYNLELYSDSNVDDLFWIEQQTGIINHNCLTKDTNAMIFIMEQNDIDPLMLKASWEQNKKVRKNWDWANNSSAVKSK
jgi:hypothetical protein